MTDLVGNGSDNVVAVGLGHLVALGVLYHLLVLDWHLLAHAVDLGLALGSRGGSVVGSGCRGGVSGISLGLFNTRSLLKSDAGMVTIKFQTELPTFNK